MTDYERVSYPDQLAALDFVVEWKLNGTTVWIGNRAYYFPSVGKQDRELFLGAMRAMLRDILDMEDPS